MEVLTALYENQPATLELVKYETGLCLKSVERALADLSKTVLVEREPSAAKTNGRPPYIYTLSEYGEQVAKAVHAADELIEEVCGRRVMM
jgi:predicted transcriptional regulator